MYPSYDELSGIDKRALQQIIILNTTDHTDHTDTVQARELLIPGTDVKFSLSDNYSGRVVQWTVAGCIWRLVGGGVQYLGEE